MPGARQAPPERITLDDKFAPEEVVVAYHERTKHHHQRPAAGPDGMDWATQPDPFRRYRGAELSRLPLAAPRDTPAYWQLYVPGAIAPEPLTMETLSLFFRRALSLTAWKQFRSSTWSLRANPSSGNLHPTEGYAVLPALGGLHGRPAVYHYAPLEHAVERRANVEQADWAGLKAEYPRLSFLVGLSSIHWREAWKYGERAYRYCQHDLGHALAALRVSAASLGWRLSLIAGASDDAMAKLFGLDHEEDRDAERETPGLIAAVSPALEGFSRMPEGVPCRAEPGSWRGAANALGPHHDEWPAIDEVSQATIRRHNPVAPESFDRFPSEAELFARPVRSGAASAERVTLGRRSAVRMDGASSIPAGTFFEMLARLVPTRGPAAMPWDALPWKPRVHVGLFVHRVDGLHPGLYLLARDPDKEDAMRVAMRRDFLWERPPGCPRGLALSLLARGDCRALATSVSCGQDVAGDGAFSASMLGDYMDSLITHGASFYRNLLWEAGMVGQVLYLEAEAAGVRATGIGSYFDDPVHQVFDLVTTEWQSLYHLAVGRAVDDERLVTLPAYDREPRGAPDQGSRWPA